jgi:hypothetical protein
VAVTFGAVEAVVVELLDSVASRLLNASFWMDVGHFGVIATDLDSRRVMDGMHADICVGLLLCQQLSLQNRVMWHAIILVNQMKRLLKKINKKGLGRS